MALHLKTCANFRLARLAAVSVSLARRGAADDEHASSEEGPQHMSIWTSSEKGRRQRATPQRRSDGDACKCGVCN